jgi:hypothetical protein
VHPIRMHEGSQHQRYHNMLNRKGSPPGINNNPGLP